MKKFKTKKCKQKTLLIIIFIITLIIFTLISFLQLNKSYTKITKILLNDFNTKKTDLSLNIITSNLDNLLTSYAFNETNKFYEKKIYLYTTHDKEEYQDHTTIYDATKLLKNNLNKLGIKVIQEERKTSDYLITGLNYYDISKTFIKDIMKQEKDISYYIDIHRDSVKDTRVEINNKKYAKILFVLGLENNNYLENKEIISQMNDYLNTNYPGISRGIYEKKGKDVDGVYNQNLSPNVLLIEIGGIENNYEEINNSTEILSLMLYHILGD